MAPQPLHPKSYGSSTNNISSQKVMAAQPAIYSGSSTIYSAKKLWQLNQQYFQPKSYGSSTNNISSQKVLAAQPAIYPAKTLWQLNQQYIQPKSYGSSNSYIFRQLNNIFSQNVLTAQPTVYSAKTFWQLNQQYLQPNSSDSSTNNFSSQKICVQSIFMVHTVWNCSRIVAICPYFTGHSVKVKFVLYHL